MLDGAPLRARVVEESPLYRKFGAGRLSSAMRETEVPALAGCGRVDSGFGFGTVASEGWGGGVARCKSSLSVYVPGGFQYVSRDTVRAWSVVVYLLQPGIAIRDPSDSIAYCSSLSWEQDVYHRRHKAPWWDIVAGEVAHWNSIVSVCVGRRAADAQTLAHERREWTYNMTAIDKKYLYISNELYN